MSRASKSALASKPKPKPKPRTAQCMTEGCKRPSKTRGVCGQCYSNARVLILNGDATWKELESIGLVRPAHDQHTKNLFRAAFLAAIEKQGSRGGRAKVAASAKRGRAAK